MGTLFGSLTGGGGISAGGGKSESGDASAGLTASYQYNGAFQVGGSGLQTQSQSAAQDNGPASGNKMLIYVAIGVGALGILLAVIKKS